VLCVSFVQYIFLLTSNADSIANKLANKHDFVVNYIAHVMLHFHSFSHNLSIRLFPPILSHRIAFYRFHIKSY
jgi:hypothetical protein